MCLITGKTMMDRNAPNSVLDTVETSARDSADLIAKWHQADRMRYAITVRFAVTSTDAQLQAAGELYRDYPDCLMHTHISESAGEIEIVKQLFPWSKDYTDVYDRFNLLGANSIFAHGIHLSERESQSLHDSGSMVVHCPTSTTFLFQPPHHHTATPPDHQTKTARVKPAPSVKLKFFGVSASRARVRKWSVKVVSARRARDT